MCRKLKGISKGSGAYQALKSIEVAKLPWLSATSCVARAVQKSDLEDEIMSVGNLDLALMAMVPTQQTQVLCWSSEGLFAHWLNVYMQE